MRKQIYFREVNKIQVMAVSSLEIKLHYIVARTVDSVRSMVVENVS